MQILLVYVVRSSSPEAETQSAETKGRDVLQEAKKKMDEAGVPYQVVVGVGHPGEGICKLAQEYDVDLIVMGTRRGSSQVREWVKGSVSRFVLTHADRPVYIAR